MNNSKRVETHMWEGAATISFNFGVDGGEGVGWSSYISKSNIYLLTNAKQEYKLNER